MTKQDAQDALDEALDALDGNADYVLVIAKRADQTVYGYRGVPGRTWKELAKDALDVPQWSAIP